jgi:hypothetical protein
MIAMADDPAVPSNVAVLGEADARLPESYKQALAALEACDRIDECRTWADKAAAMASYARQAKNHSLEHYAQRIRLRAVRRMGELLKEIPAGQGARDGKRRAGAVPPLGSGDRCRPLGASAQDGAAPCQPPVGRV